MIKSLSKKAKKVIEEGLKDFMNASWSLAEIVRVGARMMLQASVEEEVTAFLGKDYYGREGRGNNGDRCQVLTFDIIALGGKIKKSFLKRIARNDR